MQFIDLGIKVKNSSPGTHATQCPKCSETRSKNKNHPCLSYHIEEGNNWWHCNHCNWGGNLESYAKVQEVYKDANYKKTEVFSAPMREFFTSRGINPKTAIEAGVYQTTKGTNSVLAFPFYKGYTLVNVKFRVPKPEEGGIKHWQISRDKGSEAVLMGLNRVKVNKEDYRKRKNTMIITEGETDYLSFLEAGCENVTSVPEGSKQNPQDYMGDKWSQDILKYIDIFYIAVDNDSAGRELKEKLCKYLGRNKCMIVDYGKYNDANDVLRSEKGEGLALTVAGAKPYPISGIVRAEDILADIIDVRDNGWDRGYLRDNDMDNLYTFKAPYQYTFTGVPKSGKTEWVLSDLNDMLNNNPGKKIAVFSPEMRPAKRFYTKMIQKVMAKNIQDLSNNEVEMAVKEIDRKYILISPDRREYETFNQNLKYGTLEFILEHVKHLALTEGIIGYLIDPWNKLEHDLPKGMSETNFTGRLLDRVLDFNEMYDLFSVIIAHPVKTKEKPSGNFEVPGMYDISGSSNWFNKSDIGVTVHRDPYFKSGEQDEDGQNVYEYNTKAPTKIIMKALKFQELGNMGKQERYYDPHTDQFTDNAFKNFEPMEGQMEIGGNLEFLEEEPF